MLPNVTKCQDRKVRAMQVNMSTWGLTKLVVTLISYAADDDSASASASASGDPSGSGSGSGTTTGHRGWQPHVHLEVGTVIHVGAVHTMISYCSMCV